MSDDIRLLADLQAGDVYRSGTLDQAEQIVTAPRPARGDEETHVWFEYRERAGGPVIRAIAPADMAVILVSGPSKGGPG